MHVICLYRDGGRGRVGIPFCFLIPFSSFQLPWRSQPLFLSPFLFLPSLPSGANLEPPGVDMAITPFVAEPFFACSWLWLFPQKASKFIILSCDNSFVIDYLFKKVSISLMRFQEEEMQITKQINYKFRLAFESESVIFPPHLMYIFLKLSYSQVCSTTTLRSSLIISFKVEYIYNLRSIQQLILLFHLHLEEPQHKLYSDTQIRMLSQQKIRSKFKSGSALDPGLEDC